MRTLAWVLSLPPLLAAVAFLAVLATTPATPTGLAYGVAVLLLAAAGTLARREARRRLALAAVALLALTVGLRVGIAAGGRHLRLGTALDSTSRWIDRVLDEEDLAVNGARALAWTGFVRDPDVPGLAAVMRGAYGRMRAAEGATPSPVVATYAGLEAPGESDTVEIGDVAGSEGVLVFLHGYAGSFTLPCWVVSRAAAEAGFATVCPATRWVGDWWSADGEATLRGTVADLRRRGARRLVLAGLSNGGIGASLLAPRLRGAFDGLIVLSGASPSAAPPSVPVLAIQGAHDAQIPAEVVRAYAAQVGGRYLSLDAGHFALLVREDQASPAITAFLSARRGEARELDRSARREPTP